MLRRLFACMLALFLFSGYGCAVQGRVLVIGDSNVVMSADVYAAYLYGGQNLGGSGWTTTPPGYLVTFAAVSGTGFKNSSDWASSLASVDSSHEFDAVVLSLGLNDAVSGSCTTDLAAKIDAVIAALPSYIPIIVVDAPYVPSTMYSQTCLVDVNLALQAEAGSNSRVIYVNVNNAINQLDSSLRYTDGVHFTDAAALKVAQAVHTALDSL